MIYLVEKLGRFRTTILITLFALVASQLITYITYGLMHTQPPVSGKIASVASPILIAPLLSWSFIGLLLKIRELEKQMRELAAIDTMTGLYNRNAFLIAFESLLHFIKRSKMNMVVLYIDIDNFKQINDTFGHDAGDIVLQKFAHYLKKSMRESDIVGRIGGDEFIMCLPNTDDEGGLVIAEKIREGITDIPLDLNNGTSIRVTISIGMTMCTHLVKTDLGSIIKIADTALYAAKSMGKNKVHANQIPQ